MYIYIYIIRYMYDRSARPKAGLYAKHRGPEEDQSSAGNHGGDKISEEESWKRNPGGIVEKESWRKND